MKRNPTPELIFYSDRSRQYCSDECGSLITINQFLLIMSGEGNCYDNVVVKSLFHTLKTAPIFIQNYRTKNEAKSKIFKYIEILYNKNRSHSPLNYLSPVDFKFTFKYSDLISYLL